jgi:hypothetical protein
LSELSFPQGSTATGAEEQTKPAVSTNQDGTDLTEEQKSTELLSTATETPLKGPALGPELFVDAVFGAYTTWLEREIVNGPIGRRLCEAEEERRAILTPIAGDATSARPRSLPGRRRSAPPCKVLIAAALPPLVEDGILHRIVEKYVERLEGEHEKAQAALSRTSDVSDSGGSRTPWARGSPKSKDHAVLDDGLATLCMSDTVGVAGRQMPESTDTDEPADSPTSTASGPSAGSELFDSIHSVSSAFTGETSPTSPATSNISSRQNTVSKTPISTLLEHDPPLCTIPVRVSMTDRFNALLRAFCEAHPTILGFVDISPHLLKGSLNGQADRARWACPVDPTNIHPLWEPTLPFWLEELEAHGVPTKGYSNAVDSDETYREYEIDKKRRTAAKEAEFEAEANGAKGLGLGLGIS